MPSRVVLVLPATDERRSSAISQAGAEHLGLGYLAAYLRRQGHRVFVLNFQVDAYLSYWEAADRAQPLLIEECARRILELEPDLVGMSITGVTIHESLGIARALKRAMPSLYICWGGHQAYYSARSILEREFCVDSIVAGDGEIALGRLVAALSGGEDLTGIPGLYLRSGDQIVFTGSPVEPNLDELPRPDRDTLEELMRRGATVSDARISTSRGCPFQCTFCVDPSLGYRVKWRARSAEGVVEEIQDLAERFGISFFWFSEDNFIPPTRRGRERAARIADLLIDRGLDIGYRALLRADAIDGERELLRRLVQSGLRSVYIGIESGSPRRLEYFKKLETPDLYQRVLRDLRDARVGLQIGFIMFDPLTSWDDLLMDAKFLHEVGEMYLYSNFSQVLDVFPGTEISRMLIERGLLDPGFTFDSPYDRYDYEVPEIGSFGRACQRAYCEELVEFDKLFQRIAVVDLPGLWRMEAQGRVQHVGAAQEIVDGCLSRLNDLGFGFFIDSLELARSRWNEEAFAIRWGDHLRQGRQFREHLVRDLGRLPSALTRHLTSLRGLTRGATAGPGVEVRECVSAN